MSNKIQRQDMEYWQSAEQRFSALYPDCLAQEEINQANEAIWRNAYPTLEMAQEDEQMQQDLLHP